MAGAIRAGRIVGPVGTINLILDRWCRDFNARSRKTGLSEKDSKQFHPGQRSFHGQTEAEAGDLRNG